MSTWHRKLVDTLQHAGASGLPATVIPHKGGWCVIMVQPRKGWVWWRAEGWCLNTDSGTVFRTRGEAEAIRDAVLAVEALG
jgi:hypothetical protein